MAAIRLGTVLTNLTGTADQILKVKHDETGFQFFTPATLPAYSISNASTDRALDASSTGLDELANVVATLISDLGIALGIGSAANSVFDWTTTEQVWPFEKENGATVYAKKLTGNLASAGSTLHLSVNPVGGTITSITDIEAWFTTDGGLVWYPYAYAPASQRMYVVINATNTIDIVHQLSSLNGVPVEVYIKYTK